MLYEGFDKYTVYVGSLEMFGCFSCMLFHDNEDTFKSKILLELSPAINPVNVQVYELQIFRHLLDNVKSAFSNQRSQRNDQLPDVSVQQYVWPEHQDHLDYKLCFR